MKTTLTFYAIIILLAVETTGCTTVRIRTNAAQADSMVCKDCKYTLNRWFWGYLYNGEVKIENCDSKALQAARVKTSFWQGAVAVVTLGIYCPVDVEWSCAKEQ
ncbi:MAG: hypothetical protein V4725_18505 [Bacteroidota bacterium]|nr:hypothetical protein [Ferruginibacter sp.]